MIWYSDKVITQVRREYLQHICRIIKFFKVIFDFAWFHAFDPLPGQQDQSRPIFFSVSIFSRFYDNPKILNKDIISKIISDCDSSPM